MLRMKNKVFFRVLTAFMVAVFSISAHMVFAPKTAVAADASVKIAVEYRQNEARSQLALINKWRAGSTWYYNSSNSKIYLSGLRALKYDYTLEKYAMQRAAEIALSFEHTRPTGTSRTGLSGYLGTGENIAATTNPLGATADYALTMFKEENKDYGGQGHRRMMLSVPADFDAVGIAHIYYKGCYYWVQIFGVTNSPDTRATTAVNGNRTMTVELDTTRLTSESADMSELNNWEAKLNKGETDYLPSIILNLGMAESWPYSSIPVTAVSNWSSSNTGVATVNSNAGTITGVNTGSSSLTVKEPISGTNTTKTVTVTDPNAVTGVSLSHSSLSLKTNASSTITATVSPSSAANKNVTWSTSNSAVATVSSSGVVKGIKAGTATITATTVSGGKSATCKVTVSDVIPTGVNLDRTALTLDQKASAQLKATVSPSDATNKGIIWSSDDSSVATVDNTGKLTGVSYGTTTITAKTVSGSKTAVCRVNVNPIVPTGITLDRKTATVSAGAALSLIPVITPANADNKNVTWSSSDTSVATVDSSGVVTAKKKGNAVITARTDSGSKQATCSVTVVDPVYYKNNKNSTFTGLEGSNAGSRYFAKGIFDNNYNKLVYYNGKWYVVKNGVIDLSYTGLWQSPNGSWYYTRNGILDKTYTNKLAQNPVDGLWYFVKSGVVTSFTGLGQSPNRSWYYVEDGILDKTYTGLAKSSANGRWYYTKSGILDKTYTNKLAQHPTDGKWYFVKSGMVTTNFTGLAQLVSDGKWHYVKDGVLDTTNSYTGLALSSSNGKWYYTKNGVLDKTYTNKLAKHPSDGKWYFVKAGMVTTSFTGLAQSPENGRWYFVRNGVLDKSYTGLAVSSSNGKLYYAKNGILDKTFSGNVVYQGKSYKVVNGLAS